MEVILRTHELTKKYRNITAVDHVDINVYRGDIYGFVGANGAGKTTIIRLICGLASPTSGSYELFGVQGNTPEITKTRKRISAIVESPAIYTNMTAKENIEEQCRILGIKPESSIKLLDTVGLGKVAKISRKAGNFSLGMRQRLGIAMALCGDPEFLILDEPLNGLDPQGIIDIRELILKLNREKGITFLISSHMLSELSLVATRYGFISEGKLLQQITSDELHQKCRKSIDIELDNPESAASFIKEKFNLTDCSVHGSVLRVFDNINVGILVSVLQASGYNITRVNSRDDNLEDYYLQVIGGDTNV